MPDPTDFDRLLDWHREVYASGFYAAREGTRRYEFGANPAALPPALAASYWLGFHERARGCDRAGTGPS